jgi:omega-6 fatty acid desaturase (delta-12 desaturase)
MASVFDERRFANERAAGNAGSPLGNPDLKASDHLGAMYTLSASGLTAVSLWLSWQSGWGLWICGQLLLAIALLQWFVIVHEAGHGTLFRSAWGNRSVGYLAGFLTFLPFPCWKLVHARHHRWTGWQDMDTTTASLVPRTLKRWERWTLNAAWASGFPLFSILYRLSNYWNYRRLKQYFPKPRHRTQLRRAIAVYLTLYIVVGCLMLMTLGFPQSVALLGLANLLTLVIQDPLILSQHTHIPMRIAKESIAVYPVPPADQGEYTRSLVFPQWFARGVLLNFDAHELHHVYPSIPGYHLHRLGLSTANAIPWWKWLWQAKRVPGEVLLFQNRDRTGFDF